MDVPHTRRIEEARQKEIAGLNQLTENERLARVRIEERLGGWRLDAEAQTRLIERLKPFKDTPFDFWVNPDEASFLNTMDAMLGAAGWKREKPLQSADTLVSILLSNKAAIVYVSGFIVEVAQERWNEFEAPVTALVEGLIAEGIPAKGHVAKGAKPNAIHIVIGKRE